MRTILVNGFAAYILERGHQENPSQYETFKGIIESVRCGGIKVPMEFDGFGRLHFQDGGPGSQRTVYLNGTHDIPGEWDVTEQVVTIYGQFPSSKVVEQRAILEEEGLVLGRAISLPFHQERWVRSIVHENDRLTYHFHQEDHSIPWHEFLETLEGHIAPAPGILDHMQG